MCSISGFFNPYADYSANQAEYQQILKQMTTVLFHRGPDECGFTLSKRCGLAHTRLSIIDLKTGSQPMVYETGGFSYQMIFNGEIYNLPDLKQQLASLGYTFRTTSDTEVLLLSFLEYGPDFVKQVDGIFSFAVYDERHETIYLFRDYFGVKPLFYTFLNDTLIFSSEIKGLFCYPGVEAAVDSDGLNEIFSLGPARSPGSAVFHNIHELKPGFYLSHNRYGTQFTNYWRLSSMPHRDSYEDTIEKTRFLLTDAIRRQLVSDVPVCTFLSGGVDSSVVSAVCAAELRKKGVQLTTFSFDFKDNDKYFKSNSFQPSQDAPFVKKMVDFLKSNHHYLTCDNRTQADLLYESVDAHDLPCMADIDSSLLYFCREVSKSHKVVLTGECADEIFGGYPWFYRKELYSIDGFPWMRDLDKRMELFSDEIQALNIKNYVMDKYHQTLNEIDYHDHTYEDANKRKMIYLNMEWFMQTLLTRSDSQTMRSSIELRVPFANKDIVSYLYNVPWEYMYHNDIEKGLLRDAFKDFLPSDIYNRKKNPYPKTHSPLYRDLIVELLKESLNDENNLLLRLFNRDKLIDLINSGGESFKYPWFGQLMTGPQLLAYFYQIYLWGRIYHVEIELE